MYLKGNRSVSVFFVRVFLLLFILCFVCLTALRGEGPGKKVYDSKLDSLWSRNTYIHSLSNDGNWMVVRELYTTEESVIHIINTEDSSKFRIRDGSFLEFSNDNNWFGSISPDNELEFINLRDNSRIAWFGITSYHFSPSGDHFAAKRKKPGENNSLMVVDIKDTSAVEFEGIGEYLWNPKNSVLAVSVKDSSGSQVFLHNALTHRNITLLRNNDCKYTRLLWSDSGNALVFIEQSGKKSLIHHYNILDSVITSVDVEMTWPPVDFTLMIRDLSISSDGSRVMFSRGKDYRSMINESPQIWNTQDPWIYPRIKNFNESERSLKLTLWDIQTGKMLEITDEETPDAKYNPNYQNALVYNKLIYEPQYKQETDVDLYIKNLDLGEKHLVVRKQYTYFGFVKLSPTRRYVTYFKDKNWWVYDSKSHNTVNLTEGLSLHFERTDDDPKDDKEPYGNPGWTENEEYIILYDRYDIWLMTPDGCKKERITHGREHKIRYRLCLETIRNDRNYLKQLAGWSGVCLDLNKLTLLNIQGDDFQTGYAILRTNKKVEIILYDPGAKDGTLFSDDKKQIVFKRSKFNIPPSIYVLDLEIKKEKQLYQSNVSLLNYDLGRDELLIYRNGRNFRLSGVLIYPAHFDPDRKYPMIVDIYEKNSSLVNSFNPPSNYEEAGFNILRYVTNNYFVLLPDIEYKIGKPGNSALKAVAGLTEKVLEKNFIDRKRVGLIGHSFGGYEAAFIATQTEMFSAVVAGAPITDLPSWYHDIQWEGWDTEQMWRTENHQLRMGGSYYDLKNQYRNNSPLQKVEKLKTPLLLWTGKTDYNVNWYQGVYMFMAMKRLNKEGKLLLFNDEGHTMAKLENKKRLAEEIYNWFNYYLNERRGE